MSRLLLIALVVGYCTAGEVAQAVPEGEVQAFLGGAKSSGVVRRYNFAAEVTHNVGRRLQNLLQLNDNRNYLISPLSVAVTIGQLMLASRGATHQLLRDLLTDPAMVNITDVEIHKHLGTAFLLLQKNGTSRTADVAEADAYKLTASNKFFMQVGLMVKTRFLKQINTYYAGGYVPVDFRNDPVNTMNAINKWGSDNTGGLIDEILDAPLPLSTAVVFMNALYFRAPWESPFSAQLTKTGHFRVNVSHVIEVQQMRGQFDLKYAESEKFGCRLVVLPYKGQEVKMYVILPNVGVDIKSFYKMSWSEITEFVGSATEESVTLILPKMKLTTSITLRDAIFRYSPEKRSLPEMRAPPKNKQGQKVTKTSTTTPPPKSSSRGLNLTGASSDENFNIDDIRHQVSLEVTETGTEAAAISIGSGYYSGDVKNFKVERPFIFFIRHEASLVNLFYGVVTDPTNGDYH